MYLSDLHGTLVAVKQLKLDKVADVEHMNEIKALRFVCYDYFFCPSEYYSILHHPNIVLFMGYTCQEDVIQIITNYVHGNDLYHLIFTEVWDKLLNDIVCHHMPYIYISVTAYHNNYAICGFIEI